MNHESSNKELAISLFSTLFLHPEYVTFISAHLIESYPGEEYISQSALDWFGIMIRRIIEEPLKFEIVGFKGTGNYNRNNKIILTLRLFGTGLHEIPLDIFLDYARNKNNSNATIHEILIDLLQYERHCFTMITTQGMDGEIKMTHFRYNEIMKSIFRPEFIILTCFRMFMICTFIQFQKEEGGIHFLSDYLKKSVEVLTGDLLSTITCERTVNVLRKLKIYIDSTINVHELFKCIGKLWKEEAEDAFQKRHAIIYEL